MEDEKVILEMITVYLEELGYTVLKAFTPSEAIRQAGEHNREIDLLITDVVMPEMNGMELTKMLSSLYPQIKNVFMSGYTADIIAQHGVLDEGTHFIQKPFHLDVFAAKVREVLDS